MSLFHLLRVILIYMLAVNVLDEVRIRGADEAAPPDRANLLRQVTLPATRQAAADSHHLLVGATEVDQPLNLFIQIDPDQSQTVVKQSQNSANQYKSHERPELLVDSVGCFCQKASFLRVRLLSSSSFKE